jgi:hypothetical protein
LLSEKGERASAPNPAGTPFVDEAGVFFDEAGVFFDEARVFFDDLAAIVLLRVTVRAGRWVSRR